MFEIKYLKQGIDGFESYLRVDNDQWVRLDILLEFYLTDDVKISKEFKGRIKSYLENVEYATSLLPEIRSKIFEKSFNY